MATDLVAPQSLTVTTPSGDDMDLVLRALTAAEYPLCEDLQRATWGESFAELVASSMQGILHKIGGIVTGAFDAEGRLLGFVLGLTGVRDGALIHWSHMAAVDRSLRGCGMGRHLKLYQRRQVMALGCELMEWTYDPLESVNAHLNLNRLGAEAVEYRRDVYGDGSSSVLHKGIGTDRFVVRWHLPSAAAQEDAARDAAAWDGAPVVNVDSAGRPRTDLGDGWTLPPDPALRVEIPASIQHLKDTDVTLARAWRSSTRHALEAAFAAGRRIRHLHRTAAESGSEVNRRFFYCLEAPSS